MGATSRQRDALPAACSYSPALLHVQPHKEGMGERGGVQDRLLLLREGKHKGGAEGQETFRCLIKSRLILCRTAGRFYEQVLRSTAHVVAVGKGCSRMLHWLISSTCFLSCLGIVLAPVSTERTCFWAGNWVFPVWRSLQLTDTHCSSHCLCLGKETNGFTRSISFSK